ncbi:MAG: hypothetical protein H6742_13435 [Alphaproteobacteria bacterium]|nr:hypothetical protein [Alphaproteobacteria bacterium]
MDRRAWTEQLEATLDTDGDAVDTGFLRVLMSIAPPPGSDLPVELVRARAQAALGDLDAARKALPDADDALDHPDLHRAWAAAATDLAGRGAIPNDWRLGRTLGLMGEAQAERGEPADALDILERHVHAALGRGALPVARRGIELAQAVVDPPDPGAPRLSKRRRKLAEAALDRLQAELDAASPPPVDLPDDADALLADLGADPEADLFRLHAALDRWPHRADLLHAIADAWLSLADEPAGIDAFARHAVAFPDDLALSIALGRRLLARGMGAELDLWLDQRFLSDPSPAVQAAGWCLHARARLARAALPSADAAVDRALALVPGHAEALALRDEIAAGR